MEFKKEDSEKNRKTEKVQINAPGEARCKSLISDRSFHRGRKKDAGEIRKLLQNQPFTAGKK